MELHLTDHEAHLLRDVLDSYLRELRGEIVDTDNSEYKRTLRAERDALVAVRARLDDVPEMSPPMITRVVQVAAVWSDSGLD